MLTHDKHRNMTSDSSGSAITKKSSSESSSDEKLKQVTVEEYDKQSSSVYKSTYSENIVNVQQIGYDKKDPDMEKTNLFIEYSGTVVTGELTNPVHTTVPQYEYMDTELEDNYDPHSKGFRKVWHKLKITFKNFYIKYLKKILREILVGVAIAVVSAIILAFFI